MSEPSRPCRYYRHGWFGFSAAQAPREENIFDRIRAVASRNNLNVHDVSVQDLSGRLHVEQHLELDEGMTLIKAHDQVTLLESQIRRDVPEISSILTRAIRRVEARWRDLYGPSTDVADIPRILAASALAADRGDASFIDTLTPRPSLRLSLHLVDLLEDELLELGRTGETPASQVLQTVGRLRVVRSAIERRFQQLPGAPLVGIDGLEFLIEFVHDMRSPLNSLLLLADRLQQGWSGPLTALQLRQLRLIYAVHAGHGPSGSTSSHR